LAAHLGIHSFHFSRPPYYWLGHVENKNARYAKALVFSLDWSAASFARSLNLPFVCFLFAIHKLERHRKPLRATRFSFTRSLFRVVMTPKCFFLNYPTLTMISSYYDWI
jgi:hypothetical protein